MKNLKYRLKKTLVMPITLFFGYNEGFTLMLFYIDNGRKARALLALEYDVKHGNGFCFDILFLGIKLP